MTMVLVQHMKLRAFFGFVLVLLIQPVFYLCVWHIHSGVDVMNKCGSLHAIFILFHLNSITILFNFRIYDVYK